VRCGGSCKGESVFSAAFSGRLILICRSHDCRRPTQFRPDKGLWTCQTLLRHDLSRPVRHSLALLVPFLANGLQTPAIPNCGPLLGRCPDRNPVQLIKVLNRSIEISKFHKDPARAQECRDKPSFNSKPASIVREPRSRETTSVNGLSPNDATRLLGILSDETPKKLCPSSDIPSSSPNFPTEWSKMPCHNRVLDFMSEVKGSQE